ncbi:hypothetical protein N7481_004552 [Penicillium waksmanii]|uniref:uncharacterized protein n=1 Tax=Penicillium waksmanii TaxID=69791 RepID=UPI002548223B|nr:uncharacterized protein N7481_004552 [Penicillium waksmanii]KAJ5989342.1 hypothetical protein N7481_004552 [Penicillium waksmanii]
MLSGSSASRASHPHARHLLRPPVSGPAVSRPSREVVGWIAPQQKRSFAQRRLLPNAPMPLPFQTKRHGFPPIQSMSGQRLSSSTAAPQPESTEPGGTEAINALIERINENEDQMAQLMDELDLMEEAEDADGLEEPLTIDGEEYTLESWVQMVRQQFGDTVPDGALNDEELQLYTSLYGEPNIRELADEDIPEDENDSDRLFREDGQGGWEEIEFEQPAESQDDTPVVYDMDASPVLEETIAMQRTREVAEQLGGEVMMEQFVNEAVPDSAPRSHPLTREGKFETEPGTINLPKKTVTGPISIILSEFSNKHIADTAHRLFGGPGLPNSTTTPPPRAQLPQLPIPISASQHHMGEMEANAYLAALYPGIYASVLCVLVEVRKRLGTDWIRKLISQEGGPNVLDASGGGAGILAWRDIIRAEYQLMVPDHPEDAPVPYGRSTVLTGSEALRLRASAMLDNTSFLPGYRTIFMYQYDVIIAPHSLLGFEEDYQRKEYVENLWQLLNPDGGVLVLLEKGRQKGFECIAGAREMLLKRHIASPNSTEYENPLDSPDSSRTVEKESGMIIAPCTNHSTCPMHNSAGPTKGRKDYCHFEQRYIRPPFLQRIMGAKDRNHEDIKFSYIAVQRGQDLRQQQNIQQNSEVTDAAFEGFEHLDEPTSPFHPLSLPRAVYPPLKRRGHVIFDLCTPAGKIERWTVPRSYSRQAYRDARKSHWGKKERLARRAADKAASREVDEEGDLERDEEDDEYLDEDDDLSDIPDIPKRNKGQNIPSWKKHNDKKKLRQAYKRRATAEDAE